MQCDSYIAASRREIWFVVLTLAILLQCGPAHAQKANIFAVDFSRERSEIREPLRSSGNSLMPGNYEITRKESCDGARSLWISLSPSDPIPYRSELRLAKPVSLEYGTDYEVTLSLCVPEFPPDLDEEVVVLQFHSWPDVELGEAWKSPHLRLGITNNKWLITSLSDSRKVTPVKRKPSDKRFEEKKEFDAGKVAFNRWQTWVFKVRFSPFSDGRATVFRNGEVVASWSGPNAFNDKQGPFLKFGLYVPASRLPAGAPGFQDSGSLAIAIKEVSVAVNRRETGAVWVCPISLDTGIVRVDDQIKKWPETLVPDLMRGIVDLCG